MFKNLSQIVNQNKSKYMYNESNEKKNFQSVEESAHWISFNVKKLKEAIERLVEILANK